MNNSDDDVYMARAPSDVSINDFLLKEDDRLFYDTFPQALRSLYDHSPLDDDTPLWSKYITQALLKQSTYSSIAGAVGPYPNLMYGHRHSTETDSMENEETMATISLSTGESIEKTDNIQDLRNSCAEKNTHHTRNNSPAEMIPAFPANVYPQSFSHNPYPDIRIQIPPIVDESTSDGSPNACILSLASTDTEIPFDPASTPETSTLPSSPSKRKHSIACMFCRGRKIACGAPSPDNPDKTCNQCQRRQLVCVFPQESRRGMRKKSGVLNLSNSRQTKHTPRGKSRRTSKVLDSARATGEVQWV